MDDYYHRLLDISNEILESGKSESTKYLSQQYSQCAQLVLDISNEAALSASARIGADNDFPSNIKDIKRSAAPPAPALIGADNHLSASALIGVDNHVSASALIGADNNFASNIIIGIAKDINPFHFTVFAGSLRDHTLVKDVDVVIFVKKPDTRVVEIAKKKSITLVEYDDHNDLIALMAHYHPSNIRWTLMHNWFRE